MDLVKSDIEAVYIIEPKLLVDHRGWFAETYSKGKFLELGIDNDFVAFSAQKGTLRDFAFR